MIIYKVRLTKIVSTHNNLRTNEIEGMSSSLPVVGQGFNLTGESLTKGMNARLVSTTEIKEIEQKGNEYIFKTLNSTYKLEVLDIEDV